MRGGFLMFLVNVENALGEIGHDSDMNRRVGIKAAARKLRGNF